jgi:hypothetical protein
MFRYRDFENLSPETIQDILAGRSRDSVSPDVVQFVLEMDAAARFFKGNVMKAAKALREEYPHLTIRTARERVYASIRYLHVGEKSLSSKDWYTYYADRYEELASLYSRSPQTVRYAKRCFDSALECRLKVSDMGVPEDFLKIRTFLISPDVSIDRLSITEINLHKAFKEGMKLIDTFDISEMERKRIGKEFSEELGVRANIEITEQDGR